MTVLGLQRAIVPVVVLDDERGAEPLADALTKGGITCAEITFRTAAAPSAIRRIAARPDFLVGAGTVITTDQVDAAVDAGARFIVSPGLDLEVVARASELGVTVLPGIATPSELQAAVRAGLSAVKVFPSSNSAACASSTRCPHRSRTSGSSPAAESGRIRREAISIIRRCLRSGQAGWSAGPI
jgi:Entner-Doudoroff aldolase